MNTNGSMPKVLDSLFDAGLDSIRISLNSVRKPFYDAYFRPTGYEFSDVLVSLAMAAQKGKFISINYLNCPGFTDTPQEVEALIAFLGTHRINHIQWRNLNFDPMRYWSIMNGISLHDAPVGMKVLLKRVKTAYPNVTFGYFNPPKEKWDV